MICLVLALPACAPTKTPILRNTAPAVPSTEDNTCGARNYAHFIGQKITTLEKTVILRPVRVIRPDTAATLDYKPERLNIIVSEAERIERLKCG